MELKPQKIDVVIRYFLPVIAGIELNVWQTYRALAKNGWDITIHTTRDTYTEKNSLLEKEIIDGLKIRRYPFHPLGFRPAIDWNKTDAVCLHNFDIFPHFWIMARTFFLKMNGQKKYSLFVTPHGGFSPEWSVFPALSRNIKRIYTYTLGVFLLNRTADGIRAVSPWEAEEMVKKGLASQKIKLITNGLEDEAYLDVESNASSEIKNLVKQYPRYIFDNSRIKSIKNIGLIIKALAKLPEDVHFVHIGTTQSEEYRNSMFELARSMGIENRVHFLGVVRGSDKYYLYKNAIAFVHPAIWEANANVVHEAWSQRLITIVGDTTGMRSQVQDGVNGFRTNIKNVDELAAKISTVLENRNPSLLESMRNKNMEYVNNHSWKQVGERMGQFYNDIHGKI